MDLLSDSDMIVYLRLEEFITSYHSDYVEGDKQKIKAYFIHFCQFQQLQKHQSRHHDFQLLR